MAGRRTDEQARATKAAILREACDLASVDGFDGVTIGQLAERVGLSKAGVLGHFANKEQLQLAIYSEAARAFRARVIEPARRDAPEGGRALLLAYAHHQADFIDRPEWVGGCLLSAGAFEWDDREGALAEAFREGAMWWQHELERRAREALDAGELPTGCDPVDLAFVFRALVTGAVQASRQRGDAHAGARLERALRVQLGA
ncbi:MAG: TetR/AcrR family transcriptional regulator [Patulibacter minatonensis]